MLPSRARAMQFMTDLVSSLWFIPALLTAASIGLAGGLIALDLELAEDLGRQQNEWLMSSVDSANRLLAAIGASAISVAGVLFSVTMLVLSTASAQFGPQLLTNFMRHRGTHLVLGVYVGVFTYCLIVLRFSGVNDGFVPHIAVNVGLLLGLVGFFLLIYFIHHVTSFIRVANVIDDAARRIHGALHASFPEASSTDSPDEEGTELVETIDREGGKIIAIESGCLQVIDHERLLKLACDLDLRILLHVRAGHFLLSGHAMASVLPPVDESVAEQIRQCTAVGVERSMDQDPEFAIRQLVEIALRALSPGVNEPFTAISCLDRLAVMISLVAERRLPSRYLVDGKGEPRVVLEPLTYEGVVHAAFDQVRQSSQGEAAVVFRFLEILVELGQRDLPEALRAGLWKQFEAVREQNSAGFRTRLDQDDYERRCSDVEKALR